MNGLAGHGADRSWSGGARDLDTACISGMALLSSAAELDAGADLSYAHQPEALEENTDRQTPPTDQAQVHSPCCPISSLLQACQLQPQCSIHPLGNFTSLNSSSLRLKTQSIDHICLSEHESTCNAICTCDTTRALASKRMNALRVSPALGGANEHRNSGSCSTVSSC